jgi:hypothetical protein
MYVFDVTARNLTEFRSERPGIENAASRGIAPLALGAQRERPALTVPFADRSQVRDPARTASVRSGESNRGVISARSGRDRELFAPQE